MVLPATFDGGPVAGFGTRNFVTDEGVIVLEFQTTEKDSEGIFKPTGDLRYLSAVYETNAALFVWEIALRRTVWCRY